MNRGFLIIWTDRPRWRVKARRRIAETNRYGEDAIHEIRIADRPLKTHGRAPGDSGYRQKMWYLLHLGDQFVHRSDMVALVIQWKLHFQTTTGRAA